MLRQRPGTRGLACARLEPRPGAIQLITHDGEHLGRVRPEGSSGPDERRVAVLKQQARQVGTNASAAASLGVGQAYGWCRGDARSGIVWQFRLERR